jgi:membrane-bound inhibitor of C-type lysozyme
MPKKKANADKKIYLVIGILGLVIFGLLIYRAFSYQQSTVQMSPAPAPSVIAQVVFKCQDKKTINATFYSDKVALKLSDGRDLMVPQAVSADGARYANSDESFVFWNKGNTAFVQEGQATTFADCKEAPAASLAPTKGDVTIKGQIVCLPHKNQSGPQTMECAYGLQAANGQYYGLSDKDPQYQNISAAAMNTPVEVSGSISLTGDSKYDTIGTIFVSLVTPVN